MMTPQEKEARYRLYEQILEAEPGMLERIRKTETECQKTDAVRLYLYVFVPMLTGFVQWVLEEALRTGKKRLYFLSRDGYQMFLLARKLNEERAFGIDCRYLYVSRYSMRIPEYHLSLDRAIDQMCVNGIDVSLKKILQRAALTEDQIQEVLKETRMEKEADRILTYREVVGLREKLKASPKLKQYITEYSLEAFDNAFGYLKQEGLLDGVPFALVDSGWIGTLQQSIENLLKTEDPGLSVEGYYFGMYGIPENCEKKNYHSYYFSAEKGLKRKVEFANSLFEAIVSSDDGMTVKYEFLEEAGFSPVKEKNGNPNREQMCANIAALEAFLKLPGGAVSETKKLTLLTEKLLHLFMAEPSMLEVEAYGDNLFSDDIVDENRKKVAAELTEEEIRNQRFWNKLLIVLKVKKGTIRESAWLEGSIVRLGGNVRSNLWHARFYKRLLYIRKQLQAK